jgi:hypothetical protein
MTNGAPDPGPTLGAVRAAGVALEDAIRLAGQRQDRISADITAARAVLQEAAQAEVGLGTAAPEQLPERAAAAIEKSAAALKASCDLLGVSGLESKAGSLVDEWKECRATIDRCDKILVDLRKTGFGLVTAIVGAAAFVFKDASDFGPKSSLLVMLVLLILTLYLIDLAHQTWLGTAVKRAVVLEVQLNFELTGNIGKDFAAARAVLLGFILYFILLAATSAIFWFSVPAAEVPLSGHHITVYSAFAVGLASMIVGLSVSLNRCKILLALPALVVISIVLGVYYH